MWATPQDPLLTNDRHDDKDQDLQLGGHIAIDIWVRVMGYRQEDDTPPRGSQQPNAGVVHGENNPTGGPPCYNQL